jgi:hypothetical protein
MRPVLDAQAFAQAARQIVPLRYVVVHPDDVGRSRPLPFTLETFALR